MQFNLFKPAFDILVGILVFVFFYAFRPDDLHWHLQSSVPSVCKHPLHWNVLDSYTDILPALNPFYHKFPDLHCPLLVSSQIKFLLFIYLFFYHHSTLLLKLSYKQSPQSGCKKTFLTFWKRLVSLIPPHPTPVWKSSQLLDFQGRHVRLLIYNWRWPLEGSSKSMWQAYITNCAITCLICNKCLGTTTFTTIFIIKSIDN